MCWPFSPWRWLCCCFPRLNRLPFVNIIVGILSIYILFTSIIHILILILTLLNARGISIPLVEKIDEWILYCMVQQPKNYGAEVNTTDNVVRLSLSMANSFLTFVKALLLMLTNGSAVVDKISTENYKTATETWNGVVANIIYYSINGIVSAFDWIIRSIIQLISSQHKEWSIIISSSLYTILALITLVVLLHSTCCGNNNNGEKSAKGDDDSAEEDSNDSSQHRSRHKSHHRRHKHHRKSDNEEVKVKT